MKIKARLNKAWHAGYRLLVGLALTALLVSSAGRGVAFADEEGISIVVDANSPPCMASNHHFTTIGAAVTFAAGHPGATINVCPGAYGEQVELDTPVTLKGVTVPSAKGGNGAGAAIITVPTGGLTSNAAVSSTQLNQVLVRASGVALSDLTVDGTGALTSGSCSSNYVAGVDFDSGASGTMRNLVVTNQNQSNGSGGFCGRGIGILVSQGAGEVTIRNSSMSNFDFVGIGALVPVDVEKNTLRWTSGIAGILLETTGSAQSTISSNTIVAEKSIFAGILNVSGSAALSGNSIAVGSGGVAILDFSSGETVISGNALSGDGQNEVGIATTSAGVKTVLNNNITGLGASGTGIALYAGSGDTVEGNTINGAGTGISSVTGNTVSNNTFFNVGQLTQP